MKDVLFGGKAQVIIGAVCFVLGIAAWVCVEFAYGKQLDRDPLVAAIFRVSMFFGLVACYSIVSTGLGYRKTEHVETKVANIEQADQVNVTE